MHYSIPRNWFQLLFFVNAGIALLLFGAFWFHSFNVPHNLPLSSHAYTSSSITYQPDFTSNDASTDTHTDAPTGGSTESSHASTWLVSTMMPYFSMTRRAIIRSTWQTLYNDPYLFTPRFIVSRIPEPWKAAIAAENATYGDIWELDWLEENAYVANHVKSIEYFKYLVRTYGDPLPWKFVSKIDDDSYLDVPRFHEQYLEPLLLPSANMTRTIIARRCKIGDTVFAGGQFYTMSRDMLPLLGRLHDASTVKTAEDFLNAKLLQDAGEKWTLVNLPSEVAYDYKDPERMQKEAKETKEGEKTEDNLVDAEWDSVCAGNKDDVSAWVHPVNQGSINPHKMKKDVDYLRVAAAFDERGCRCKD